MNIVSQDQWKGWFAGLGEGGVVLQNVIIIITPMIMVSLAIYFIYQIWKIGASLSRVEGPEQRKEAKTKMAWLIFGLMIALVGPTLILIFMKTIGNTVQTQSGTSAIKPALTTIITLNIKTPNLLYN